MNIDNLFTPELNALTFGIVGLSIVFFGLIIISLYIKLLPFVLKLIYKDKTTDSDIKTTTQDDTDNQLLAIATAYHLNSAGNLLNQKITWINKTVPSSPWATMAKISNLITKEQSFKQMRK